MNQTLSDNSLIHTYILSDSVLQYVIILTTDTCLAFFCVFLSKLQILVHIVVICMAMTCMFGAWEIFEGCSLKPKSSFIVLHHSLPIHKTMEGHWASRALHETEPTCMDAAFIKYWSGCVRMRAWKPQLCGKLQMEGRKKKNQAFMNNLEEAL